jgi:hypothetical protein
LISISIKEASKQFCKKSSFGPRKMLRDNKNGLKSCELVEVFPHKLKALVKICFVSKIIIFQKTLEFKHVIAKLLPIP